MRCPCGSETPFDRCCGPYVEGRAAPPTAEALMRARYVAYTRGDIAYIAATTAPESLGAFDASGAKAWAAESKWLGLRVLATDGGGAGDDAGTVEFVATYRQNGATIAHRELSRFRRAKGGEWRFVDGDTVTREAGGSGRLPASPGDNLRTVSGETQKLGRNDPCACGSGNKFKKCCGAAGAASESFSAPR